MVNLAETMAHRYASRTIILFSACLLSVLEVLSFWDASASPPRQTTPVVLSTRTATPVNTGTPLPNQKYVVQPGDSLWIIAQRLLGDGSLYPSIAEENNLPKNFTLRVGMTLLIPYGQGGPTRPTSINLLATPTPFQEDKPMPIAPMTTPNATALPKPIPAVTSSYDLVPRESAPTQDPKVGFFVMTMNSLGVLCLFGSISCSVIAIESFQRSRLEQKRMQMMGRLRERGLDELLRRGHDEFNEVDEESR